MKTETELKKLKLARLQSLAKERYGSRAIGVACAHGQGQDPMRAKGPWIRALLAPEAPDEAVENLEHEVWARRIRQRLGLEEANHDL